MLPILSFDIGSTYTKGALFDLDPRRPRLLRRDALPTTVHDLSEGFSTLLERLREGEAPAEPSGRKTIAASCAARQEPRPPNIAKVDLQLENIPIYACSSAKGGLAIVALGIVPDLTLHAAKLAAASAGGKIVAAYAYKLTEEQIVELKQTRPDVILFSGGTDGGNEDYPLHNARMLAAARLPSVVLYAGNAALKGEIRGIFGEAELEFTENLMPEVGKLHIEPARAKIQEIFLKKIIEGKGLGAIGAVCAGEIKPTPRAVFDLLVTMSERLPQWSDFALVDLGGATTDFYSCTESFRGEEGFVLKGLREPKLKRTVEGDLGLRISARSTWETGRDYIERQLKAGPFSRDDFTAFCEKISGTPEYLPYTDEERQFDAMLAGACVYHSLRRHAGSIEESYAPSGKIFLQQGKDLRAVKRMVLSGGGWQRERAAHTCQTALATARRDAGEMQLLPSDVDLFADKPYILPLLGNLARDFPAAAARLADECSERVPHSDKVTLPSDEYGAPSSAQ